MLPKYQVAIIDEAHTLESVAGEHLGLKISSIGVDYTLSRLYNERTGRGLLSVHHVENAMPLVSKARTAADDFFETIAQWHHGQREGFNGRVRKPIGCPETLPEELNKLATAIGDAAREVKEKTERIELEAAEKRCRALAGEITDWLTQAESKRGLLGRGRREVAAASAAGVGSAGRRTRAAEVSFSMRFQPAS